MPFPLIAAETSSAQTASPASPLGNLAATPDDFAMARSHRHSLRSGALQGMPKVMPLQRGNAAGTTFAPDARAMRATKALAPPAPGIRMTMSVTT